MSQLQAAVDRSTDRPGLAAAVDEIAARAGLIKVGADTARFDHRTQKPIAGTSIRQGAPVIVLRPGYAADIDGERIVLMKADVQEWDDQADADRILAQWGDSPEPLADSPPVANIPATPAPADLSPLERTVLADITARGSMSREQLELAYPDLTGKERAAVVARLRKAGLVGGTGRIAVTGQGRWLDEANRAPAPDVDSALAALDRPAPRAARRGPADAVTVGARVPGTGRRATGKDLLSAPDSRALAEEINQAAVGTTHTERHVGEFMVVAKRQGFDGKPRVVDAATMDRLIADGQQPIYRGLMHQESGPDGQVSAEQFAERFRSGDYYASNGTFGTGIYTTFLPDRAATITKWGGGVMRMVLAPDARVADWDQLKAEHDEFRRPLLFGGSDRNAEERAWVDVGTYAAARGFDAIRHRRGEDLLILNRTAVIVEAAPDTRPRSRGRLRRTEDRIMSTVARLSDSIGGRDSGTVTTAQLQTALPDVPDADRQTIFDDLVERGLLVVNPDGTIRLTNRGRDRQPGSPRLTGAQRFGMTLAPEDEDQAHITPQARRLISARMTVRRLIAAAGGDLSNLPDTIAAADWRRLVAAGDLRLRPGVDPMRGLRGSDLELTAQGRETLRPEPGMLGQPGRPQPATGQDWRAAMREISERLRDQMSRPA